MERAGYEHLDLHISDSTEAFGQMKLADFGVVKNDTITTLRTHQSFSIPRSYLQNVQEFPVCKTAFISTMHTSAGAGFYNSNQGMLPYYFGKAHGESYLVYKIR